MTTATTTKKTEMNDFFNASHIVTVLVALVGWFAVHRLTSWRDRVNHKRKISPDMILPTVSD